MNPFEGKDNVGRVWPAWATAGKNRGRPGPEQSPGSVFGTPTKVVAAGMAMVLYAFLGLSATTFSAAGAPVGQGFTVTASDLAYILKQIKVAEAHVANTTSLTGPCGALVGPGANQVPDALTSYGLRTVDGSCNNLLAGRETYGAADVLFPRLTTPVFKDAEASPPGFPPAASSSYTQKSGFVYDSQPREISNLIVDQTATNPAAIAAAGFPVRSQSAPGLFPCTTDPQPLAVPPVAGVPLNCVPSGQTLFIPNITTDVGLSPPYNSMFTLFGQFFDHGVDQTVKGGGTVFVPLKDDDPLIPGADHVLGTADDLPVGQRFMVLTRAQNQPGVDGVLGTADDVQDAANTDTPYVDQSQTYTSHPSHQVFLREYVNNSLGKPVSTGKLLGGPAGPTAGGMATWAQVKKQSAELLGLLLADKDVLDVPQLAVDPYGKFIPGPVSGLPQYVTASGLVEGNLANPVPVPADVVYFHTPFLTDIAHNAEPKAGLVPDADTTASADFAAQPAGTYDDEMLGAHFTAGDGRVNENIGLTTIHQVFHSEHDRLVGDIENTLTNDTSVKGIAALAEWKLATGAGGWNGERLFQAARFVTEMEYQHLVFEEFGRKIQPAIQPFHVYHTDLNPAVKAEFAHAVYRFGHSMLTETIARTNADGTDNSISLLDGFLNPPSYTDGGSAGSLTSEDAAGSVVMGMSDQTGNELDEFVTDTLRNNLLGLPLDLATLNMTRARDAGVPPLNEVRRQIFNSTGDGQLTPYSSWADFGQNIKHPESLINFVAAYGTYPTITSATTLAGKRAAATAIVNPAGAPTAEELDFLNSAGAYATAETGVNSIDLWIGGLAEKTNLFGGLLGSTFNYVFENQMTDLQNGDRFYYLLRTPGMNLRTQLEGNSFAEMIMRNTNANTLKADVFATADCKFQMSNLAGTAAGYVASGPTVGDDPKSECNETALLLRKPDGTIQYKEVNTIDPVGINGQSVYNGTAGADRVAGGNDNDTFLGNEGDDVIAGMGGDDVALGGDGNDRITDSAGDDVLKGGPGNDYINSGIGLDIMMAGDGQDFVNGGANDNETFAGPGNDFVRAGDGADAVFGDGGDDWIQGGSGQDLLIGDHSAPFFNDPGQTRPGNDIFIGQVGENDYDAEGGDDIMTSNAAIDRYAAAAGFDWANHQYDTVAADDDMKINQNLIGVALPVVVNRDRWQEVEANSGSAFNDVIRGDDVVPSAVGGAGFSGCDVLDQAGIDRIAGLGAILPAPTTPLAPVEAASPMGECPLVGPVWGDGNILLGGLGSDTIEGRGANDVIDGDRYLRVRISVRDAAGTEIGSTDLMEHPYLAGSTHTLEQDVAAGVVDPGNLVAVREIITPTATEAAGNRDSAVFSGLTANYTVTTTGGDGTLGSPGSVSTVVDNVGTDGTDTLRNIERLAFLDTVAPGTPIIGLAAAGNATATVDWTAAAGATATGFSVKVLDATGTQVGALRPVLAGFSRLIVTGLTNGVSYTFQVSATNAEGTSPFSASSNAVTPVAPPVLTVAGAPTIGTPVAGDTRVTVNWTAPAPLAGAAPITGYRILTYAGTAVAPLFSQETGNVTSGTVLLLTNGTAYTFTVEAINSVGIGAPSARSVAVTPAVPVTVAGAPTIGIPTAGIASATVNWTAPASDGGSAITGYTVRAFNGATLAVTQTVAGNVGTVVVTGLTNGTAYTFDVAAVNAVGTGAFSARSAAVTPRADFIAPTVTARTPAAGALAVSQTANLTATFSEPVTGVSATSVVLTQGATAVPAVVTYNTATRVATLNPNATLVADRVYTVTISGIRDVAGNVMIIDTWTFTTGPAPTIVTANPAAGDTGVGRNRSVVVRFSEAVTGVTGATVQLTRVSNGAVVAASNTLTNANRGVTITPTATLLANTRYRVTITGGTAGVRDLAGNPLVTQTWVFTTR
ncbi:Ca2+-binding RTX toxin-like protein [Cryobacterium sp. MP_M5]|uniref:peroxidase family protein n=1 Tax=unclassified Cryobacterium TaxID=2649013 RepID=UPI0018CAF711|nr:MULTISPECIES: peroxidase family protein [unclassified Cryobacterium]MBG6059381.1 Ca2+-binding RTX toxin-like protein [Cryobacterium sp. MP_M3]MEC5177640.1 Ca2+-binding RTX toxin-like protein [Cryobacterium sp. MP_M5]